MIGKYVEYFIVCDGCETEGSNTARYWWVPNPTQEDWEQYPLQNCDNKKEFGFRWRKEGWIVWHGKHYCPKCIYEWNEKRKQNEGSKASG